MKDTPLEHPMGGVVKPLNVIVVGGSLSGLMTAILLKRQGHNIYIIESASSTEREGMAAGVAMSNHITRFFDEHDRVQGRPNGPHIEVAQILGPDLEVKTEIPINIRMATWDAMYYRLKANLEGEANTYCPNPPSLAQNEGSLTIETGKRVVRITDLNDRVQVTVNDLSTGGEQTYEADRLIAADGAHSTIRKTLYPEVERDVPGFLIWRGTVPTAELSEDLLDRIEGKSIFYPMQKSYLAMYTIPGSRGSIVQGERHINFAWYDWPPPNTSISSILTDTRGHTHRTTLPKGLMRPEVWSEQLSRMPKVFHPLFREIPSKLKLPFVSVISSVMTPQAVFFGGKGFFVGDALVQMQPNTGQGVNHAAMEIMLLGEVFEGNMSAETWETNVMENARAHLQRSKEFAKPWLYGDE